MEKKLNKLVLRKLMNLRTKRMLEIIGYRASEVESRRLQYAMIRFQSKEKREKALKDMQMANDKGSIRELLGMDFDLEGEI